MTVSDLTGFLEKRAGELLRVTKAIPQTFFISVVTSKVSGCGQKSTGF